MNSRYSKKYYICINHNLLKNMKNLRKLAKSDLKMIVGGGAPECTEDQIACYYPPKNGYPSYWRCVPISVGCPD